MKPVGSTECLESYEKLGHIWNHTESHELGPKCQLYCAKEAVISEWNHFQLRRKWLSRRSFQLHSISLSSAFHTVLTLSYSKESTLYHNHTHLWVWNHWNRSSLNNTYPLLCAVHFGLFCSVLFYSSLFFILCSMKCSILWEIGQAAASINCSMPH